MKMYDKKELEYKNGYIVKGDDIICIDNEIVDMLNNLETDLQLAMFNKDTQDYYDRLGDCNKEFRRRTERGKVFPTVTANTPTLYKKIEETLNLMDEIDSIHDAEEINEYLDSIHPLILFAEDDFVVSCENSNQHRFDLPIIGNPLTLNKDLLFDLVADMF